MRKGDLAGIEHYTNEAATQAFAISIAAIATFQAYRFLKTQQWAPEWLRGNTHNLSIVRMPSGGTGLAYKLHF